MVNFQLVHTDFNNNILLILIVVLVLLYFICPLISNAINKNINNNRANNRTDNRTNHHNKHRKPHGENCNKRDIESYSSDNNYNEDRDYNNYNDISETKSNAYNNGDNHMGSRNSNINTAVYGTDGCPAGNCRIRASEVPVDGPFDDNYLMETLNTSSDTVDVASSRSKTTQPPAVVNTPVSRRKMPYPSGSSYSDANLCTELGQDYDLADDTNREIIRQKMLDGNCPIKEGFYFYPYALTFDKDNQMPKNSGLILHDNKCCKSCCSQSWPVPFDVNDCPTCTNGKPKYMSNSYSCQGPNGAGCICMTPKERNYLVTRGNNAGTVSPVVANPDSAHMQYAGDPSDAPPTNPQSESPPRL